MREIHDSQVVRVYTQKELALILGMEVPDGARVTVTNTSDNVSIIVRNEKETRNS